jgi:uracil-DNA glycosylase
MEKIMMTFKQLENETKLICENYKDEKIGGWITGIGPIPCDVMLIGEAPGKSEIEFGKPFVGMAGKNLDNYLKIIGLSRTTIRISNTCCFRPIKTKIGNNQKITISNRTPKASEVELFREVLNEEIKLVNPKIIITLGNIPLKRFTQYKSIGECHGTLLYNKFLDKKIFAMYHPSALTYNRNETFVSMYMNDWLILKKVLENI